MMSTNATCGGKLHVKVIRLYSDGAKSETFTDVDSLSG